LFDSPKFRIGVIQGSTKINMIFQTKNMIDL